MKRRLMLVPGLLLFAWLAVVGFTHSHVGSAVIYSALALGALWMTIRPEPAPDKVIHPFRAIVALACSVSVVAAGFVTVAVTYSGPQSRAPAVVAAAVGVPFAIFLWWLTWKGWQKGFRWSSTSTVEESRSLSRLRHSDG